MELNDLGGVVVKYGFLFQDCVVVYYVIRMFRDKIICSVCCEVIDDIDIVFDGYIDFVQVKSIGKICWNILDIVQNLKGVDKKMIFCSLILYKLMQCEFDLFFGRRYFIVIEEKVNKIFEYLMISLNV